MALGRYLLNNLFLDKEVFWIHFFIAIALIPYELSPFLMLKAVWRVEFGWNQKKGKKKWTEKLKGWLPSVHFAKATHGERASDRLDARTPWTVKFSVSIHTIHDRCRTHETSTTSSSYHPALPIISSHPQCLSFSSHLSVQHLALKPMQTGDSATPSSNPSFPRDLS